MTPNDFKHRLSCYQTKSYQLGSFLPWRGGVAPGEAIYCSAFFALCISSSKPLLIRTSSNVIGPPTVGLRSRAGGTLLLTALEASSPPSPGNSPICSLWNRCTSFSFFYCAMTLSASSYLCLLSLSITIWTYFLLCCSSSARYLRLSSI